jgi:hypothetical protein
VNIPFPSRNILKLLSSDIDGILLKSHLVKFYRAWKVSTVLTSEYEGYK